MKIVVIDNYDSFTYNLVHYLEHFEVEVTVFRNDEFDLAEIAQYNKILLSPGPGLPENAGLLKAVIREYGHQKSIFGVCLGLQAIAEVYGSTLINLATVYHGIATIATQTAPDYLFNGLPKTLQVGRYHSWAVASNHVSKDLIITSVDDKQNIMSMKHKAYDVRGVQYHPESILTPYGKRIIENWVLNSP